MCVKNVRCGDIGMLVPPLSALGAHFGRGTLLLLTGRRPSGYRGAAAIAGGLLGGFPFAVDTGTRPYHL